MTSLWKNNALIYSLFMCKRITDRQAFFLVQQRFGKKEAGFSKHILYLCLIKQASVFQQQYTFWLFLILHVPFLFGFISSHVCKEKYCEERGMYTSTKCRNVRHSNSGSREECAIMLTDFPGIVELIIESESLVKQILLQAQRGHIIIPSLALYSQLTLTHENLRDQRSYTFAMINCS